MNLQRSLMSEEEARWCVKQIRAGLDGIRETVLDLYEREGWRSLGYESWRECVVAEFGQSQATLYRALEAGQVDRAISQLEKREPLPYTQARELARLKEPETIREVWHEVREATPQPTARVIRKAVQRRLNPPQEFPCTRCGQINATPRARTVPTAALPASSYNDFPHVHRSVPANVVRPVD